jgi:hypothetical protein
VVREPRDEPRQRVETLHLRGLNARRQCVIVQRLSPAGRRQCVSVQLDCWSASHSHLQEGVRRRMCYSVL